MPRIAASNPNYSFVLRNDNTGRYLSKCTIELPSVTTVIKRVLAKTALVPWTYRQTLDAFVGVIGMVEDGSLAIEDLIDTFSDVDMAAEWMKENALRPEDFANDAAKRGRGTHDFLERLAKIGIEDDEAAEAYAKKHVDGDDPFVHGVCQWWLDRNPSAVAAEEVVWSTRLGVAGSIDLVWIDRNLAVITDLKTRKAGSSTYDTDFVQVDGYMSLWNERHPEKQGNVGSVLYVCDDGTYSETDVPANFARSFDKVKELHDMLRGKEV